MNEKSTMNTMLFGFGHMELGIAIIIWILNFLNFFVKFRLLILNQISKMVILEVTIKVDQGASEDISTLRYIHKPLGVFIMHTLNLTPKM